MITKAGHDCADRIALDGNLADLSECHPCNGRAKFTPPSSESTMSISIKSFSNLSSLALCCVLICASGCSSLGLSAWPAQFHLLPKTKQYAAASPLPSGLPNELAKFEIPTYHLEPGDRILIEPVNLDSEIGSLGDQKIQIDGSVDLGKFGRIRVSGMSVEEVEQAVEDQISVSSEREPINVQLVESNAAEVYILGEVGSPAAYRIDGHEHVLDAILLAGGLTSKASPCDIVLVRPTNPERCRVVLPVCYRQITQLGDVTTNYQLQPGDRIVVGSRSFHEEFAFWKQDKGCGRCSRSCCVECQPGNVQYQKRFLSPMQPFKRPATQSVSQPPAVIDDPTDIGRPKMEPLDSEPRNDKPKSDEDLFLPKLKQEKPESDQPEK